jgi:hypothetical protein
MGISRPRDDKAATLSKMLDYLRASEANDEEIGDDEHDKGSLNG